METQEECRGLLHLVLHSRDTPKRAQAEKTGTVFLNNVIHLASVITWEVDLSWCSCIIGKTEAKHMCGLIRERIVFWKLSLCNV